MEKLVSKYRFLALNAILLLTLAGSLKARDLENATPVRMDFLRPLNLPFRGWRTADSQLTPGELSLLQPDAVLVRRYVGSDANWAELAVIAGHRKCTVHTPAFCMAGGGWETLEQATHPLRIAEKKIQATRSVMTREGHHIMVTYYFTDGSFATNNLVQFQAHQLMQRLYGKGATGALVRIITPVVNDVESAGNLSDEFAGQVLPHVMRTLGETGS